METVGSLIDRLCTVDLKMWNAQEELYKVRRMTFIDFKEYLSTEENQQKIYDVFKKSCDLNYQRNQLIDEIDERLVEMMEASKYGVDMSKWVQKKHKTY